MRGDVLGDVLSSFPLVRQELVQAPWPVPSVGGLWRLGPWRRLEITGGRAPESPGPVIFLRNGLDCAANRGYVVSIKSLIVRQTHRCLAGISGCLLSDALAFYTE